MPPHNQNDKSKPEKKKHHFFPKPSGYRAGSFLYSFLPFSYYPHAVSRRDQEDEILAEIQQKHAERENKHFAKKNRP